MQITIVLNEASTQLNQVINRVKLKSIDDNELILYLSMIKASLKTLEIMTGQSDQELQPGSLIPMKTRPSEMLVPSFIQDVSDDEPDEEDKDIKKIREETRSFFG